jgi:hypothetical protein
MTYNTHLKGAALAAISGGAASNPDGTTVKATAPVGLSPANNATSVSLTPTLSAQAGAGKFQTGSLPHRFQVSTSESFDPVAQSGLGSFDAQGIVRFTVPTALTAGTKYYWRVRPEAEDQPGSWSATVAFTTTGTVVPPPRADVAGEKRTPNPPAGQQLPLPNMYAELIKFTDFDNSCPLGVKYVNNPWQDRVIDHFRTFDTRWGYNAKPNRTAADNGGRAVVAAGDEAAYNSGSQADEGTTQVQLVDMLIQHCGSTPSFSWRVFTGEEPGRWTGAGRF